MKISIAVSVLILVVGTSLGWRDQQRLAVVRESHAKLVAEAAKFGISLADVHSADPVRITKRERADSEAAAKLVAAEFLVLAKEMEAIEEKGDEPDEAMQKRLMEFIDRMMSLDAGQLRILIAEVRSSKDLKDETREGLIGFSIMTLANDHPQAALALLTESADIMKKGMGEHVVSSSLAKWAKDDPLAALEWVRKNSEKFPDLVTDDAKLGVISGTAPQDPKLAFQLIGELGLKDTFQAFSGIIRSARTPEERTTTLTALREHLDTITDEKSRSQATGSAMSMLASAVAKDGFEAGTKWVESANFSPAELESFVGGLNNNYTRANEGGLWVEWIGKALPAGKGDDEIQNIVSQWTSNDYQAAGKWLATTPDGPAKNVSIGSYAETIAKYEPETATQWAMTLPPGKDREQTLRRIYQNWPAGGDAAKAAFAKEHGIK